MSDSAPTPPAAAAPVSPLALIRAQVLAVMAQCDALLVTLDMLEARTAAIAAIAADTASPRPSPAGSGAGAPDTPADSRRGARAFQTFDGPFAASRAGDILPVGEIPRGLTADASGNLTRDRAPADDAPTSTEA